MRTRSLGGGNARLYLGPAGVSQVRNEPVDVVDQPFLVGEEAVDVPVREVDRAPQRGHERLCVVGQRGEALGNGQQQQGRLGRVRIPVRGEDPKRSQPVGDVGQGHRLELAAPADGFLVEGDGLLGRLPGAGELVQASFAVEVLYRGDAAGVDIRAQVPPRRELLQCLAELLVSADLQVSRHVLRPQMHNEALLRPREGTQHAPVEVGVGDAQVGEWLWFTLTVHRLRGSDYHHYMVTYATDRKDTARAKAAGSTRLCTALASADRAVRLRAHRSRVRPYHQAGLINSLERPRRYPLEQGHQSVWPLREGAALEVPVASVVGEDQAVVLHLHQDRLGVTTVRLGMLAGPRPMEACPQTQPGAHWRRVRARVGTGVVAGA